MPAQTNANYTRTFAITNSETGDPFDLTGLAVRAQFKRRRKGAAALTATTANGLLYTGVDPTLGKLSWIFPQATVGALVPATYQFDVITTDKDLLFGGTWTVRQGITDVTTEYPLPFDSETSSTDEISVVYGIEDIAIDIEGFAPVNGLILPGPEPATPSSGWVWWVQDSGADAGKLIFKSYLGTKRNFLP
jgi:hypothetical protein